MSEKDDRLHVVVRDRRWVGGRAAGGRGRVGPLVVTWAGLGGGTLVLATRTELGVQVSLYVCMCD